MIDGFVGMPSVAGRRALRRKSWEKDTCILGSVVAAVRVDRGMMESSSWLCSAFCILFRDALPVAKMVGSEASKCAYIEGFLHDSCRTKG